MNLRNQCKGFVMCHSKRLKLQIEKKDKSSGGLITFFPEGKANPELLGCHGVMEKAIIVWKSLLIICNYLNCIIIRMFF